MEQLMEKLSELGTISIFNIIIVAILLLPAVVFMFRTKHFRKHTSNRVMLILELVGRLACVLFMIFPFPEKEFAFPAVEYLLAYMLINGLGIVIYIALCVSFIKKPKVVKGVGLAVIPAVLFIACGITLEHYLLVFAAVVYAIGHIYRTVADAKNRHSEIKKAEKEKKAEEEAKKAADEAKALQEAEEKKMLQTMVAETLPPPQPEE